MTSKIITINRHSTFLRPILNVGGQWTIIENFGDEGSRWNLEKNMPHVSFADWSYDMESMIFNKEFSHFMVHTVHDLWKIRKFAKHVSIIFVMHIALYKHNPKFFIAACIKWLIVFYFKIFFKIKLVCISDWKKSTWGFSDTTVIKNIPIPTEQVNFSDHPKAILIGNHLDSRKEIDFSIYEQIIKEVPVQLLGKTAHFVGAIEKNSRAEFNFFIKNFQIAIYIIERPYDDGYNLGLLEAMQAGMAVVTISNPSTPVKHSINGFICQTPEEMIEKIKFLQTHPEKCKHMGLEAQLTIQKEFSKEEFTQKWCEVLSLSVNN